MAETVETLGKYEIKRTLGKGAMGTVYEGWDPIIARRVAIKTVRIPEGHDDPETEEALARFRREAQAAGRLTHPNIVGVFDYGETADLAYIVMEYVDGPSVKFLLDKQERFILGDAVRIMTDLLNGLQFSHARGVVHRDIKPANVMLTSEGQAKIADFGIARIESSSMTQAGTVLGTPAYMSPEQFMGQVVDSRTDLYSSGVLLYQLLTGERPFEGSMSAIMHKALNTDPPLPSQISVTCPAAFDGVVRKAMAKRPEARFPTAAAFLDAVQRAATGRPIEELVPNDADDGEATMVSAAPPRPVAPSLPPAGPTAAAQPAAAPPAAATAAAAPKRAALPMIAAAIGVVVLLGIGTWFFVLRGPAPAPNHVIALNAPSAAPATPAPVIATPVSPSARPAIETAPVSQTAQVPTTTPESQVAAAAQSPPASQTTEAPSTTPAPQTTAAAPTTPAPETTATSAATQAAPSPPATETAAKSSAAPASPPNQVAGTSATPQQRPAPPATNNAAPAPAQQLSSAGLDIIRRQVAQLAAGQRCALIDGGVRDRGDVLLAGLAGAPAADALRQALGGITIPSAVDWQIHSVDPVFCPALEALHPIMPAFGATGWRLGLTLVDGKTRLRDGDYIKPHVVMPDFRGSLRVDYVAHDGTVQHLYPQLADAEHGLTADPPRVFKPGELIKLGDTGPGHLGWQASTPYGTDMIIAIASSRPLFDHPRPSNEESTTDYASDLQAAIAAAQRRGEQLAGSAITLDTLAR
jgi:tRNA A-37 threonylcarbamoyl transferase component Bud32